MTTPAPPRGERIILIDANGKITDDRSKAVRGELEVIYPDGSHEHVLFEVNRPSART